MTRGGVVVGRGYSQEKWKHPQKFIALSLNVILHEGQEQAKISQDDMLN